MDKRDEVDPLTFTDSTQHCI